MRPRGIEQEPEKGMERRTDLNSISLLHFSVFKISLIKVEIYRNFIVIIHRII